MAAGRHLGRRPERVFVWAVLHNRGWMIKELRIENLVLIERAELRLGAGLNAITGETGAGKTVLAHAIDLLLGGKARKGAVRPGAGEAWVEGVFELPDGLLEQARFEELRERLPAGAVADGELTLARRVGADGRTRAFVGGRGASTGDLEALGTELVTSLGQHEHRRLARAAAQRELLDEYAGARHGKLVDGTAAAFARLRQARASLEELAELDARRERELDLIEYELEEIEALSPSAADERELSVERDRLRAVDELRLATAAATTALDADDGEGAGALTLVASAGQAVSGAAGADASLTALADRLADAGERLREVTGELRRYADGLAADPARLEQVEERLDAYARLMRKHGGSVEAVVAHAADLSSQRDLLSGAAERLDGLYTEIERATSELASSCEQLTRARAAAAARLARAVNVELADLALADAGFEAAVEPLPDGPGAHGADRVEFRARLNAGMPLAPLSETASGGELSRVMLALFTAANSTAGGTLVFDEIDAGVGGRTARAVARRLRALGERRQVICITHLAQVAAVAHDHFHIAKRSSGDETVADVRPLVADEVIEELRRMLGGGDDDAAALEHARELLQTA